MAWFSGKVSLGNFPDLAGAVNKLSESVKNIEKNFDNALGFEDKPDSTATSTSEASGMWPVMSFMGNKAEDSNADSSEDSESPKHPTTVPAKGNSESPELTSKVDEREKSASRGHSPQVQESEKPASRGQSPSVEETERSASRGHSPQVAETEKSTSRGHSPIVEEAQKLDLHPHTAEEKEVADIDMSASLTTEVEFVGEEKEAYEMKKDIDRLQTSEKVDSPIPDDDINEAQSQSQSQSQSQFFIVEAPELPVVDSSQEKEVSELKPIDSSESLETESKVIKVDPHDVVVVSESEGDQNEVTEKISPHSPQEVSSHSQIEEPTDVSSHSQIEDPTEDSSSHLDSAEVSKGEEEISLPSKLPFDETLEMASKSVPYEDSANVKAVEVEQKTHDSEIDTKEQHSTSISASIAPDLEMEKLKKEMKMMETALQGAARQAQAKADEIANMMNENENLKAVIEDLKRKSNEAEMETLREEYHQRVAVLERKVYTLTKERDTLRREQNRKSDAAMLLKEKDEIISQVMAEGEELSKKQAAQEGLIRRLRVQVREFEEEKKGLLTKLQLEENKVESIKKDKTATEKLLQETIEKHQAELAVQKEYYTNALALAKEAEALAEARANTEARAELESRLKEAEEREAMLVQALEELRQTLSRKEQQAVFREDMLQKDIEDLQTRYRASERRCEELISQVPESTRPLLRQIEAIQETTARRAEAWAAVERSLNSRLQEEEAKAAAAEERERSVNERLSQTLSRINVLEAQISCLRAEQTQLSRSLEKERQRAAENRQEYLAAKEIADTQEGRAYQLEEEIKELRRKHKQELQDALMHRELLQQEVDKEKAARMELEKNARAYSTVVSEQAPITKQSSGFENGNLTRRLSSASSLGSMEESFFLQQSLDSSDNFSERRNLIEPTSPYYMKGMTPNVLGATLRQKEGELASYMSRLASLESIRDSLAEELVKMTEQCEKLRTEASTLPSIRAELDALRRRHTAALELMGERDEELEELRADIVDMKEMYREQVNMLVNKIQIMSTSIGNAS